MSSESNTLQFRPLLGKYSALFLIVSGADFDSTDQSIGYGVVVGASLSLGFLRFVDADIRHWVFLCFDHGLLDLFTI